MHIKNQIEIGKVHTLKMNSGEEVVARIVEVFDTYLIAEEPVSVGNGPRGMGLVPTMFTAKNGKTTMININSISMLAETDETIQAKYTEATTGLQVPEKKVIIG